MLCFCILKKIVDYFCYIVSILYREVFCSIIWNFLKDKDLYLNKIYKCSLWSYSDG